MGKYAKSGYVNQWDKMEMLHSEEGASAKAKEVNKDKTMLVRLDSRTSVLIKPSDYSEEYINKLKLNYQTK